MFRKMRRKKQELTAEETIAILKRNTSGTLALMGDDGYPYSVPVSYVYCPGKIIIHGAKTGHKTDSIRRCEKVSFSVIDQDRVIPEEYTTYFRSTIVFGKMRIIDNLDEISRDIDILALKYRPGHEEERREEIEKTLSAICVMELNIEYMTGKQSIELTKNHAE